MSDRPCQNKECVFFPDPDKVHTEENAEAFLIAVLNVPGKTPRIVTTPRYTVDPCEPGATDCPLERLLGAVTRGAEEIATEFRKGLGLPEPKDTDEAQPVPEQAPAGL